MARIGRLQVSCDYGDENLYVSTYRILEVEVEGVMLVGSCSDDGDQNGVTWYDDVDLSVQSDIDGMYKFGGTNTYTWLAQMTEVPDDSVAIEYPISIANGGTGATTAAQALTNLGAASVTALDALSDTVAGKANTSHTHSSYATVTALNNLSDVVDGKANAGHSHSNYAASSHAHSISNITNLQTTLDGKAAANHSHNYAASSHTHSISNITNLQSTLDGKAASNHSHGNAVLWSGGSYMNGTQTATLSQKISDQDHGIVIVFSGYDITNKVALNNSWTTHFIPKEMIQYNNGGGQTFHMSINAAMSEFGAKYLYIYDDKITGHVSNSQTGTGASGITFSNNKYVMRYVIGF